MIINSSDYNGKCSCGREHEMVTKECIIEAGALLKLEEYLKRNGIGGKSAVLYDENTYKATEGLHPKTDKEIIFSPLNLHADNYAVKIAEEQIPKDCDFLIAIGSGTIHDITRYCAYQRKIPFVSCPTAASVDGFCSSVAAMTWDGFKKTFIAVAPKLVIADINVIKNAPKRLANAGFGDMIGKYIALADWKIGKTLTGEFFCDRIYNMTLDATKSVLQCADGIKNKENSAFEKIMYGLLMSGLAMQLLGFSRCASGAEHHISHLIEMQPEGLDLKSDALHGEKVGVGTLIVGCEYYKIMGSRDNIKRDYQKASDEEIDKIFGADLSQTIKDENASDCAVGVTKEAVLAHWEELCDIVNEIPKYEELLETYKLLGLKQALTDIEVPDDKLEDVFKYSPLVRNRLTLIRLRRAMM